MTLRTQMLLQVKLWKVILKGESRKAWKAFLNGSYGLE
jgi:hypothetical protein